MGGSFNPPTLAHYTLMLEAIDRLDADKGIFVPVSDAYLRRKMRHSHPPVVLSPDMRISMLRSMCTDGRMSVCEKEVGTVEARTIPTLMELQEENPDAELYFLMGADKLGLLIHLTEKREFLRNYKVVMYERDVTGIVSKLKENEVLSQYPGRIVILPQPEGTYSISSSIIRERILSGESCRDMLCPGVWDLLKEYSADDFPDMIDRFKGEYDFLSNRFPCQVVWQGQRYSNAEAAFQSSKCADETESEASSLNIMEAVLIAKFEQNPDLMKRLIDTGNAILINGNSKKETFWGIDLYSWKGENNLGIILMAIREREKSK